MLDWIVLNWRTAALFLYSVGGVMLCYSLRNKLRNQVMEKIPLRVEEKYQQVEEEERVHLLVMLFLVVSMLMFLLRLFLLDQIQHPATAWGYLLAISYSYLLIHCRRERLLLPLFKSKAVSSFVWLGGKLETEIYKEKVGCVLIAAFFLTLTMLTTMHVIPTMLRFSLFLLVGVYLCFRSIALAETSVYVQQVESIKDLRSTIGQLSVDDRYFLPLFPMLLIVGTMAVALVGMCEAPPESRETTLFVKGCVVLENLVVKGCAKVKSLLGASW